MGILSLIKIKSLKIILITITASLIAVGISACHTSKKSTAASASPTPTSTSTKSTVPFSVTRSVDGIYAPGSGELAALQAKYAQYKDVTLDQLTEGYRIYTEGACIKCHTAKNIYRISETGWYPLIADMSLRARLTDAEQDAIYKYVFAIKAAQAK